MSDRPSQASAGTVKVRVETVIFSVRQHDLKVLLNRRTSAPFKGRWALPGAYVRASAALDDIARQLLEEQTAAREFYIEQLYTFGAPRRDPRGRVISVAYFALVGGDVAASDENADAAWTSAYALPDLAFDHDEIIRYTLQRVRYKLEYTSVGFELLPNEFTLSELQAAYQVVLGETLDKRNFRRRILEANVLAETGSFRAGEGQGRPAKLYAYRSDAHTEVKARRLFPFAARRGS